MDAVSNCLVELIFQNELLPPVLNVVHPRPTDWNTVIKLIGDALVSKKKLDSPIAYVPFQHWFSVLEAHANQGNENDLKIVRPKSYSFRMIILTVVNPCIACCQASGFLPTHVCGRFESHIRRARGC